jgi:hypothetical protein
MSSAAVELDATTTRLFEAEAAHAPALRALLEERDGRTFEPANVEHTFFEFDRTRGRVYLATVDARPAALSAFEIVPLATPTGPLTAGYWTNLFVAPAYRNQMLYPRLPLLMLQGAREAGVDAFFAAVRRQEVGDAHAALGFVEFARRTVRVRPLRPAAALFARRGIDGAARGVAEIFDAPWRIAVAAHGAVLGRDAGRALAGPAGAAALAPFLASRGESAVARAWTVDALAHRLAPHLDGGAYEVRVGRAGDCAVAWRIVERENGLRIGVLLAVVATPDAPVAHMARLLRGIESACAREECSLLVTLDGAAATVASALAETGYATSPETYRFLAAPRVGRRLAPLVLPDEHWVFRFLDHDAM